MMSSTSTPLLHFLKNNTTPARIPRRLCYALPFSFDGLIIIFAISASFSLTLAETFINAIFAHEEDIRAAYISLFSGRPGQSLIMRIFATIGEDVAAGCDIIIDCRALIGVIGVFGAR